MLYAEQEVKRMAVVVVEPLKNAYFPSYMVEKNTVAVQDHLKERFLFVPQKLIQRKIWQKLDFVINIVT